MKKFFGKLAGFVLATGLVFAFASCNNAASGTTSYDSPAGGTYNVTEVSYTEEGVESTVTKSGTSITCVSTEGDVETTTVYTKSGDSYTATVNGVDATSSIGGSETMYEVFEEMFSSSIVFGTDNTCTLTMSSESTSGTYTVSGSTCTVTYDDETMELTTTDGWVTISCSWESTNNNDDDDTTTTCIMTFTRQ